jgi:hypothetical protein
MQARGGGEYQVSMNQTVGSGSRNKATTTLTSGSAHVHAAELETDSQSAVRAPCNI